MTNNQRNILATIGKLPARYRYNATVGGWVRFDVLESYDGRTVRSLLLRGWLISSDYGVKVSDSGLAALKSK